MSSAGGDGLSGMQIAAEFSAVITDLPRLEELR